MTATTARAADEATISKWPGDKPPIMPE
jgi:hypothetical protein